jgi:glycosyltransferase involved in cell wall biosynthesis
VMSVLAPIGGIEAALLPLALELKSRGHEVIVYLLQPLTTPNQNADALKTAQIPILVSPAWWAGLAKAGVAVRLVVIQLLLWTAWPFLTVLAGFDALYRRRSALRSLQGVVGGLRGWLAVRLVFENLYYQHLGQVFSRSQPSIVHVHGWGCGEDPPGLLQWLHQKHPKIPVIFTEHNSPDPAFMPPIPQAPMNLAEVIIAVSQAAKAGLLQVGLASRPIQVIPYSVQPLPVVTVERVSNKFVVVCVARLMPQKGHRYLIEAFARLLSDIPSARLKLAGEGLLRSELEQQCVSLGLGNQVEFLGVVTRSQLPELYAECDVVALASLWEGLPVTLIEALSAGLPIVATDVGGNAELVIDGLNGIVVPPKDVDALVRALTVLANNSVQRQVMGGASRQQFELGGFSPSSVTDRHLVAYAQAVELQVNDAAR